MFVRVKDEDAESVTFEMRFSEPILESVLDAVARETFGTGYTTSERYFTITFKGLTHKECCKKLTVFAKEFDEKLAKALLPWTQVLEEEFVKKTVSAESKE